MLTVCLIYCLIIYIIKIIVNLSIKPLIVVQTLPSQQKGLVLLQLFKLIPQLLSELKACQKYYFWNERRTSGPWIISCVPDITGPIFRDGRLASTWSWAHRRASVPKEMLCAMQGRRPCVCTYPLPTLSKCLVIAPLLYQNFAPTCSSAASRHDNPEKPLGLQWGEAAAFSPYVHGQGISPHCKWVI